MTGWDALTGTLLGALCAAFHIAVVQRRAAFATGGRVGLALATLPVSVIAPALGLLSAVMLSPTSAWAPLLGFWLLRSSALARAGRA